MRLLQLYLLPSLLFTITTIIQSLLFHQSLSLGESPPRGWNSYDSFGWSISEFEFLQNAQLVARRLRPLGYEYVVLDYLWYRKKVKGAYADSLGYDVVDQWGRMIPDPGRWPSSKNGQGFSPVAAKVHALGLKFGIHVMRGISTQAYNANLPILDVSTGKQYEENGRKWYAKDIGIKERPCVWMKNGFMAVNTKLGAGRAFLRSLYQQYAEWGVDFVKHDCVFGEDFEPDEIAYVSSVLKTFNRPIVYSLSPGTSVTPAMASNVSNLVNMYRITGDDWDKWGDVAAHFDSSRDFAAAGKIGAKGLRGLSWPDLDMLPLGWLTDQGSNEGPHRRCNLSLHEQRTQMTLWSMARSPLMFGGDMRRLDETTIGLIANPTLLEINSFSSNNKEFPYISSTKLSRTGKHRNLYRHESRSLALASCSDVKTGAWSTKDIGDELEHVCWTDDPSSGKQKPFCLYKRKPLLSADEDPKSKQWYEAKFHLFDTRRLDSCLGSSPGLNRGSFSTCGINTNQMWELNRNGTLLNSHSGSCAYMTMENVKTSGARAWIATGLKGETYVAFFNLNPDRAVISMNVRELRKGSCKCREVWSGKDFGNVKGRLSAQVVGHGTALFMLLR